MVHIKHEDPEQFVFPKDTIANAVKGGQKRQCWKFGDLPLMTDEQRSSYCYMICYLYKIAGGAHQEKMQCLTSDKKNEHFPEVRVQRSDYVRGQSISDVRYGQMSDCSDVRLVQMSEYLRNQLKLR